MILDKGGLCLRIDLHTAGSPVPTPHGERDIRDRCDDRRALPRVPTSKKYVPPDSRASDPLMSKEICQTTKMGLGLGCESRWPPRSAAEQYFRDCQVRLVRFLFVFRASRRKRPGNLHENPESSGIFRIESSAPRLANMYTLEREGALA